LPDVLTYADRAVLRSPPAGGGDLLRPKPLTKAIGDELSSLEPLGIERHADAIVPENLHEVALAPAKAEELARVRSRPRPSWTFSARLFIPQRMSVMPPAIQTFTPAGNAIILGPPPPAAPRDATAAVTPGSSCTARSAARYRSGHPAGPEPSALPGTVVLYPEVWKFALGWGHEPLLGHAPAGAAHSGIPWSCSTTMEKREWTGGRIRRLRRSWNS
jgi:hypothetical protein